MTSVLAIVQIISTGDLHIHSQLFPTPEAAREQILKNKAYKFIGYKEFTYVISTR